MIVCNVAIVPQRVTCLIAVGLLERPVEIQTGKRNRRKVDRLAENVSATPPTAGDKKRMTIPEGAGVKLGDCPASECPHSPLRAIIAPNILLYEYYDFVLYYAF